MFYSGCVNCCSPGTRPLPQDDSVKSSSGGDEERPYISLVESRPSSTKTLLTQVEVMVDGDIDEANW